MNSDIISQFGGRKRIPWPTFITSLFLLLVPGEATAYDGPYDRVFHVTEKYDYWDTNTLDGVVDGNPNLPGAQVTLRAALMEAQAQGGTTLITLGTGTYENTISQQFINANVIIEGRGSGKTILEGNHIQRAISVGDIYDKTNYNVTIIGLTIQNGTISDDRYWGGGGIKNWRSTVTLKDVVITGCAAGGTTQCFFGGGIYNSGNLTLENCTITKNHANNTGGGIYSGNTLTILNSTISDNVAGNGAGIAHSIGRVTITNSTVCGNRAWSQGGGIFNSAGDARTDIINSTISGNTAATQGGGIYNWYGGGTLTNVTLAYNEAVVAGGGVYQYASHSAYLGATFKNTILAYNTPGNCAGSFTNIEDDGGNLSTDSSGGFPTGNPLLGPLQNNGGPTFTHALFRGSAAIDAAIGGPSTDQRGVARPQDGDGDGTARSDIGAFECEGIPPLPQPHISISPGSHDFGNVVTGKSSPPLEVTISSTGALNLAISGMILSDTTNYSLDVHGGSNPSGTTTPTIPPGQNRTVTVTFAPSSIGDFGASLTINSNDPDAPSGSVSLTGNGTSPQPDISASPASVDFGEVRIGDAPSRMVTVANEGTAGLTIGTVASANPLSEPFGIVSDGCSGQTLSPGESRTVAVRFAPTQEGEFTDSFDIPSDDPDEDPLTVSVSGTGVTPGVSTKVWSEIYDGGNGNDYIWGVAFDSEGSLIAAGYIRATDPDNYHDTAYLVKYPADGSDPWVATMEVGPINPSQERYSSEDRFLDVAVDSQDNILVVGQKSGGWYDDGYHFTMLTRKYDPDGFLLWERTHHEYAWNTAWGVAVDVNDNSYVAGNVYTSPTTIQQQWAVLKYDKDGNLQGGFPVYYNYSTSDTCPDVAYDVAVDDDGNFIVVGQRGVSQTNLDWHVRKYNSNRTLVWEDTYNRANSHDVPRGVAVDSHGDVYVAGYTNNGTDYDWLVIKYNAADNTRLWTHTFESAPGRSDLCYDIVVDSMDDVLVGGYERDGSDVVHWRLERLSGEDGSVLAEQSWESDYNQVIYGLALRGKKLAIGGYESNGTDNDMRIYLGSYAAGPDISVSPRSLDFGEAPVGGACDQTVTVSNDGEADVTFGIIALDNPLIQPFCIVADECSGRTLVPAESATFTVRFSPSEEGEFTDIFDIPSDHPTDNLITVNVAGTGTPASCEGEIGPEDWSDIHDGGNGHDYTWGVAFDSQGSVISVGYTEGLNSPDHGLDAYIKKHPADGSAPWVATLDMGQVTGTNPAQKASSDDAFFDVAVDSEDNIVVVGQLSGVWPPYHVAMLTRKYAPDGALLWERIFYDYAWGSARGVALDYEDNIYVAGNMFTDWTAKNQWAILKYDKDGTLQDGFPIRENFISGDPPDIAYGVAVDGDGNFIVVGIRGVSSTDLDWHVRKYDSSGGLVWQDTYSGSAGLYDYAWGVGVDSNGDVLVAGYTNQGTDNGNNANYDWLIIKYAAVDGERLWTRTFESEEGRSEACYDVVVDGSDNVLVGGYEREYGGDVHWRVERRNGQDGSLLDELLCDADNSLAIYALAFQNRQIAVGGYENNGTDQDMRTSLLLYYPPTITLQGDSTITLEAGTAYEEPGYTATDDYQGGDVTGDVVVSGSIDHTVPGRYIVHYNLPDFANVASLDKVRAVIVVDTTPPEITLLGDNPMTLEVDSLFIEPGYTVTDNSSIELTSKVVVGGAVYTNIPGSYTLQYNVSDFGGNPAQEKVRVVSVVKPPAPILEPTAPITGVQSGDVSVGYIVRDYEGDFMEVTVAYSTDGGSTWSPATHGIGGDGTLDLSSSWAGQEHTFVWDSVADLGGAAEDAVQVRIVASDGGSQSEPLTVGPFAVDNTSLDTDDDNFPDTWEQLIVNADPNDGIADVADVSEEDDFDGDGKSNYEEYVAGTDPTDPNSTFVAVPQRGSWAISWQSVVGKFYRVYYGNQLGEDWILMGLELPGDGTTLTVTDELAPALFGRFYKVRVH